MEEGFEVESFDNIKDIFNSIKQSNAGMVITGLTLSDAKGESSIIKQVTEMYQGPFIIVSSSIDKNKEARLKTLGVKAAINKSDQWQRLLKKQLQEII
jgi:DNA-binding NtrC family response regulator